MQPYLYNVAISFAPYMVIGIVLALVGRFYVAWVKTHRPAAAPAQGPDLVAGFMKKLNLLTFAVLVAGLFYAMTSPSNTPKNVIGNIKAENKALKEAIEREAARTPADIKDIARQPKMTDAQRQEHFDSLVDYEKD